MYVHCSSSMQPTADGSTVVGGPRLLSEMSNWLVNEIHCPECPVCMDPVVGVGSVTEMQCRVYRVLTRVVRNSIAVVPIARC